MEATKEATNEILSPEGVEERVVFETGYRITMTGGGKHRIYLLTNDRPPQPIKVVDTKDQAMKELGYHSMLMGAMINDPKAAIEALFQKKTE